MAAGFDAARGDVIVPLDADLQNDPADIPLLLAKLDEGYDVVSGWRRDRKDTLRHGASCRRGSANALISRHLAASSSTTTAARSRPTAAACSQACTSTARCTASSRSTPRSRARASPRSSCNHRPRAHGTTKYGLGRVPNVFLDLLLVQFLWKYGTKPMHVFGKFGLANIVAARCCRFAADGVVQVLLGGTSRSSRRRCRCCAIMFFLIGCLSILMGLARRGHDAHLLRVVSARRPTWCARSIAAATSCGRSRSCGDSARADVRHRRRGRRRRAPRPRRPAPSRAMTRVRCARAAPTATASSPTARALLGHRRLSIIDLGGGAPADGHARRRARRWSSTARSTTSSSCARGSRRSATRFATRSDTEVHPARLPRSGATTASPSSTACSPSRCGTRATRRAPARARSLRQEAAVLLRRRRAAGVRLDADGAARSTRRCRARSIDDALAEYLALEYVVAPRTILAGVHKLPAGARGSSFDARRAATTRRYWQLRVDGGAHAGAADDAARRARRAPARGGAQAARRRRAARRASSRAASTRSTGRRVRRARARAASRPSRCGSPIRRSTRARYARAVAAHLGTAHVEEELVARRGRAHRRASSATSSTSRSATARSCRPTLLSRFVAPPRHGRARRRRRRRAVRRLPDLRRAPARRARPARWRHRSRARRAPPRRCCCRCRTTTSASTSSSRSCCSASTRRSTSATTCGSAPASRARSSTRCSAATHDVYAAARARYHEPAAGTHLERVLYQDVGALHVPLGARQGRSRVDGRVARGARAAARHRRSPSTRRACRSTGKLHGRTGKYAPQALARTRYLPRAIVDRPKKGFGMPIGALAARRARSRSRTTRCSTAAARRRRRARARRDRAHARRARRRRRRSSPAAVGAARARAVAAEEPAERATSAADRRRASTR